MRKCANISLYMRRPLVIYDFATAPLWLSLYMRKIWFSFLSVQKETHRGESGFRSAIFRTWYSTPAPDYFIGVFACNRPRGTIERGAPCRLLKLRWMVTQRVQLKGVLPWLVHWACRAGTRDFCSALSALLGPVQNIFFLTVHYLNSFDPIAGSRAGSPFS
jgi:hypothetical protein